MFYNHKVLDGKKFRERMVIDHPNLREHQFEMVHRTDNEIEDIIKVKDIFDNFGYKRYRVILSDYEHIDDLIDVESEEFASDDRYEWYVAVISFNYEEPKLLVKDGFLSLDKAQKSFFDNVEVYKNVVDTETRKWQDIDVYADQIGYHKIDPECCATCEFSRKDRCPTIHKKDEMVCSNPEILTKSETCCHIYPKNKAVCEPVYPKIKPNFICDYYKRKI